MYASLNDKELWIKVVEGDKHALSFIYTQHFPALFNYGMKVHADETIVKDCIHDLFVTLWFSRERLSITDTIRFYLLASLKRNILRSLKPLYVPRMFDQSMDKADFSTNPEHIIMDRESEKEQQQKLVKVINQLPRRQQEVLHLRYFQGLDTKEAAALMSLSVNATYVLLSQALRFLKKHSDKLVTLFLLWPF
ncbi:sigma-70 family RNA polymerase sigma factor [Chitinophaga sp.]|uniref:RNA polymerase sigma factor n=1 Tax=Chitinophaga sp. TaxID=1869181 RepID=UPI002BE28CF9|nr:sigma-70 family RNA polymerase sigma factor [Chitinophaga sp.]HWV67940.1 sigma-70 family RNA polymerase sigma factor [Chitinophaga sp.]